MQDRVNYGLIGLGTMGAALALNIAEKGYPIAVFNRTGTGQANAPALSRRSVEMRWFVTDVLPVTQAAMKPSGTDSATSWDSDCAPSVDCVIGTTTLPSSP